MEKIFEKSASDATIKEAIRNREVFVMNYSPLSFIRGSRRVERLIEECGMTCQIYTRGRIAAAILGTAVAPVAGVAAIAGLAAHNVQTSKFDYEVARNPVTGNITVTYVR